MSMPASNRRNLLWLQSGGCGGCTMSLLGAEGPDFLTAFEAAGINVLWHPALSRETGHEAMAIIDDILAGRIVLDILCLEGSVMMGPNGSGKFHMMAGSGKPMKDMIDALAQQAKHVVGVGSCAAFGGITMAGGNPGEACGLGYEGRTKGGLLGDDYIDQSGLPVVNIPGCPVHPDWVTETLSQLALGLMAPDHLDGYGRPHAISGTLVHHGCARNEFYEYKASAEKLCQIGCMMENLGCKGTQAAGDCNKRSWNGSGSCISGGYPCIACTEPGFEEPGHSFVETPKIAGIPVGLPTDMPKAWFIALASLSKAATPPRLRKNATADRIRVYPQRPKKGKNT
ncbi:MAG: HupU protein [Marinosulfonomonas sp.]|nr:MAG: HupU protein [Marinosulfonomonas sp.]